MRKSQARGSLTCRFGQNACTDEVENFRQIVATNTVILKENQINGTTESSTLRAKGDLGQEPHNFFGLLFHTHEIFQLKRSQVFLKKTAQCTRHVGKRECDESLPWKDYIGIVQKPRVRISSKDRIRIRFLISSPVQQRKKI